MSLGNMSAEELHTFLNAEHVVTQLRNMEDTFEFTALLRFFMSEFPVIQIIIERLETLDDN